MHINKVGVKHFRCFVDRTEIPLTPITLLVGENSTGKTSFLAATSAASRGLYLEPADAGFNQSPFELGGYSSIASFSDKASGRAPSFSIGLSTANARVAADFVSDNDAAVMSSFRLCTQKQLWTLRFRDAGPLEMSFVDDAEAQLEGIDLASLMDWNEPVKGLHHIELPLARQTCGHMSIMSLILLVLSMGPQLSQDAKPMFSQEELETMLAGNELGGVFALFDGLMPRSINNIAPIRAVPRRTYESYQESAARGPEGGHAPFVIERETRGAPATALVQALRDFGKASGMYSGLTVKRFGSPRGSRFAINLRIGSGPVRNLADVGYGVSQLLPQIVECVSGIKGSVTTLQQPEVHLHPRAQAAFGSLLCVLSNEEDKQFIVETHSEHIVTRIRREIAAGRISSEKVSLIFFEREASGCEAHVVRFSSRGELQGAPRSYHDFFLRETKSLLKGE